MLYYNINMQSPCYRVASKVMVYEVLFWAASAPHPIGGSGGCFFCVFCSIGNCTMEMEDVLVLKLKGAPPPFIFAKGLLFAMGLFANTVDLKTPVLV